MLGAGKSMSRHPEVCCLAKATFMALRKHLPTECAWWMIQGVLWIFWSVILPMRVETL